MTTKLSDLKVNPGNPRIISDEKLAMLQKSIDQFGDLSGIVFNRKSKQLVGGHQRLKILPPTAKIVVDVSHKKPTRTGTVIEGHVLIDGERFKYREVHWNAATEMAANIAANQHGGEWEMEKLTAWVKDLRIDGFDTDLLGFSTDQLDMMFSEHKAELAQGATEIKQVEFSKFSHKCPRCQFEFNDEKKRK